MDVKTVTQLTRAIKFHLNNQFPATWVSGEISGITQPSSGHIYFTLKDLNAQINAIIWRSDAEQIKFQLQSGMKVLCRGGVDVYPQRGSYQLIVRKIQPEGVGALELAFRQLKDKLAKEGLFDASEKRELPTIPNHIAVVTSPNGAAVRDFLQVLNRRWKQIRVTVVPAKMQGPGAKEEIVAAISACQRFADRPEVVVVTRGGGSIEDLWAFNEEMVVRAIRGSEIPVVSGIGHEIDVTLSDLAADVRALTPSEAAERVVPDIDECRTLLRIFRQRLQSQVIKTFKSARQQLDALASRPALTRPLERVRQCWLELDYLEQRLHGAFQESTRTCSQRLAQMAGQLQALSPLSVLARGYSVTTDSEGKLLNDFEDLNAGDTIHTRLVNSVIHSRVEEVRQLSDEDS